jgi:hypothetical protein
MPMSDKGCWAVCDAVFASEGLGALERSAAADALVWLQAAPLEDGRSVVLAPAQLFKAASQGTQAELLPTPHTPAINRSSSLLLLTSAHRRTGCASGCQGAVCRPMARVGCSAAPGHPAEAHESHASPRPMGDAPVSCTGGSYS